MSEKISIRISPELKQQLDFLARVYGIDLSVLVRDILIPIGLIKQLKKQIETVRRLEKSMVNLIIESNELQSLLSEIKRYEKEECFPKGWNGEEEICFPTISSDISMKSERWIDFEQDLTKKVEGASIKRKEKYIPYLIVECGYDNTTGSMHYSDYCEQRVTTLPELVLFLEIVRTSLSEKNDRNIDLIRKALDTIKSMVI